MRVKAIRHVAFKVGDGVITLRPGQIADVPKEVIERNPGWFEPVEQPPKRKTTQQRRATKR